jgi:hypothetical protein
MPQASDELRKIVHWIVQCKPDSVVPSDSDVTTFLLERGYQLNQDWTWKRPKPDHYVTEMEELCLRYMVDEWDYGWVEDLPESATE